MMTEGASAVRSSAEHFQSDLMPEPQSLCFVGGLFKPGDEVHEHTPQPRHHKIRRRQKPTFAGRRRAAGQRAPERY
jgi:hypothetical protein